MAANTETDSPLLISTARGERVELTAGGLWTVANADLLERLIDRVDVGGARSVVLDVGGIRALDVFGAWLIERLLREAREGGRQARLAGLRDRDRALMARVAQTNHGVPVVGARGNWLLTRLEELGRAGVAAGREIVALVETLGALAGALGHVLGRPQRFRLTSLVHHLDRVAWQAIPIIVLITFLIGCIIAQQAIFHFRKFGAEAYVVDLVGIMVLREIGILLVAIMVAGRSGSSYTAELGSMKMREEIDALRTMGLDPVEVLILPRVLALVIALPVLAFIGSLAALYGGGLVAWLYAGMEPTMYVARLREAVSLTHFEVGMIKAPFMALAIGAIASNEGLKVRGSAESLGLQTTSSVVKSIFTVILLDGVFAMFFASVGM